MKLLIVASYNHNCFATYVVEQVEALRKLGCIEVDFFGISGKGLCGYIHNWKLLKKKISEYNPDIIHAHYGLSGLLANLQRKIPVVTTYHGSDVNNRKVFVFSKISMLLSSYNIFVSEALLVKANVTSKCCVLPCGVNLSDFSMRDRGVIRANKGWNNNDKYVLFAGPFDKPVKNVSLAKVAIGKLSKTHLIEMKGYSRSQVADLLYAVDALLLTSISEGSPQVIKEAMACSCPIVSVDVGDVKQRIDGLDGCFVVSHNLGEIVQALTQCLSLHKRTNGREKLISDGLDNIAIAKRLMEIYTRNRIR